MARVRRIRTPVGDDAWLVSGHAEVRKLYADRRLGRTHPDPAAAARLGDHQLLSASELYSHEHEHEEHMAIRATLMPFFAGRRMAVLRESVRGLLAELLDELATAGPGADLHSMLSAPLSVRTLCALLGVPDRELFRDLVDQMDDVGDRARAEAGQAELSAYLTEVVELRRASPDDGVLSGLAAAGLSTEDIAGIATMLLFAGYDSTAVMIDAGVLLLTRHRDQWEQLRVRPDGVPGAVEEILRLGEADAAEGSGIARYARESIEIDGVTIGAGEAVVLDTARANLDERAFAEPLRFDPGRSPNPQLAFGHGPWHCLGAPLARLQLIEVFTALPARFPLLRVGIPDGELARTGNLFTERVRRLPVEW
ncbi:cytochrome P450 [Crossiella sp. CA198]|uniref:cytochrome P450 n=1 Tax=Crossiella sp. CA198 TaxID=3455607 RepID=UPI003F8D4610